MQTRKKCRRRHSRKHGGGLFDQFTANVENAKASFTNNLNQAESTLQNTQSSVFGNVKSKIAEAEMLVREKANSAIAKANNAVNQTESEIAGGKKHKRSHTNKRKRTNRNKRSHTNKRKRK